MAGLHRYFEATYRSSQPMLIVKALETVNSFSPPHVLRDEGQQAVGGRLDLWKRTD
jgi:hypothetical protein